MAGKNYRAIHRYARISPRKARLVIDKIRGLRANEAVHVLRYTEKKAAFIVHKVLRSAMSNAEADGDVDVDDLQVVEARVDEAPRMKRWKPRARGSAEPIVKRNSHIHVVLGLPAAKSVPATEEASE